jgi:hypothetical protein
MTTLRKPITSPVPAIDVFQLRCEARAALVEACLLDLHDAVDGLQEAAIATGLVDDIGQDAVQVMMADAFARPWFMYRLLIGPMELAAWLAELATTERISISKHIRGAKR